MKKLTLITLVCILCIPNVKSQIQFEQHTIVGGELAALEASSVYCADLDNDSDIDIISASHADNKIAWYENDGSSTYTCHVISTDAMGAIDIFVEDMDNDGDMDISCACDLDVEILWYKNDGNGNFEQELIGFANGGTSVHANDMDGDGDMDIILASKDNSDSKIIWYENSEDWIWPEHIIATEEYSNFNEVNATDMDNDGDVDIIVRNWQTMSITTLLIFENMGDGTFIEHVINQEGFPFFIEDIDNDGDADIVSSSVGGHLAWYENIGNLTFNLNEISDNYGFAEYAGDIEGDGDIDIIAIEHDGDGNANDYIVWYKNDGDNNFTISTIVSDDPEIRSVYASDIDDDGDLDLFSAGNCSIKQYINEGSNYFSESEITRSANWATNVCAVDLDADGFVDVLSKYLNTIAWYKNDGNQKFTPIVITDTLDLWGYSLETIDLDNDNDLDIISSDYGPYNDGKIYWLENNGNEEFSFHLVKDGLDRVYSLDIGDIDSDGDIDMASGTFGVPKFAWYENDGNGNFTTHSLSSTPPVWGTSIKITDLDSDGDTDMVACSFSSSSDRKLIWFENDGNENFTEHLIFQGDYSIMSIFCEDTDNDGDIDILFGTWYNLFLAENDGSENFIEHTLISTVYGPFYSIYSEDFDNDGDEDIITARYGQELNNSDSQIYLLENLGNNEFNSLVIAENVPGARSVYACDVDKDEDMDFLSASGVDCKIAWHENKLINVGFPQIDNTTNLESAIIFPNPVSGNSSIEFKLEKPTVVSIHIYNSLGEKVYVLEARIFPAGSNKVNWNASRLKEGIYFCRIQAGSEARVIKIMKN